MLRLTDLKKAIDDGQNIIVLDVRTPEEVAEGYVQGAKTIDIYSDDFDERVQQLDKSATIYVYCRSGHRSMNAAKKMIQMGFRDVRNVEGGIIDWQDKGYPTVKP